MVNGGSANASVIYTNFFEGVTGFGTPGSVTSATALAGPTAIVIIPNLKIAAATPTAAAAGGKLYVTNHADNTISVINMATNTVSSTFSVGSNPSGIAITPDGQYGYVSTSAGTVVLFRTADNQILSTIPVGTNPGWLTITPTVGPQGYLYVSNEGDNTISVINTKTNTVVSTFSSLGVGPVQTVLSSEQGHLYVSNYNNGGASNVALFDLANTAGATTVTSGTGANYLTLSPDERYLYVPNPGLGTYK